MVLLTNDGTLPLTPGAGRVAVVGPLAADEVVQLYVRDVLGSVTRPLKELKGFQRITLQPGEAQTVRFELPARQLGFVGLDLRCTVESGTFLVWVGPSSAEGLEGTFAVR